MSKISRSDVYARDERGPDWFDSFLQSYANQGNVKDLLDTITEKKAKTVQSVVDEYRKMVGLDLIANEEEPEIKARASRSLSLRQAKIAKIASVIEIIEDDPSLKNAIEDICKHSGGTRSTYSIMEFLRDRLGNDKVSLQDQQLKDYIENVKSKYFEDLGDREEKPGLVGTDNEDFTDDAAEYYTNGRM